MHLILNLKEVVRIACVRGGATPLAELFKAFRNINCSGHNEDAEKICADLKLKTAQDLFNQFDEVNLKLQDHLGLYNAQRVAEHLRIMLGNCGFVSPQYPEE